MEDVSRAVGRVGSEAEWIGSFGSIGMLFRGLRGVGWRGQEGIDIFEWSTGHFVVEGGGDSVDEEEYFDDDDVVWIFLAGESAQNQPIMCQIFEVRV